MGIAIAGRSGIQRLSARRRRGRPPQYRAGLGAAHKTGDVGAEVRYLSAIGTGLEWNGSTKEALDYFQKATLLAKQNPDIGYPFLTVAGQIQTLIREHKYDDAEQLVATSSAYAVQHSKQIKLTQLMLLRPISQLGSNAQIERLRSCRGQFRSPSVTRLECWRTPRLKLAEIYANSTGLPSPSVMPPPRLRTRISPMTFSQLRRAWNSLLSFNGIWAKERKPAEASCERWRSPKGSSPRRAAEQLEGSNGNEFGLMRPLSSLRQRWAMLTAHSP